VLTQQRIIMTNFVFQIVLIVLLTQLIIKLLTVLNVLLIWLGQVVRATRVQMEVVQISQHFIQIVSLMVMLQHVLTELIIQYHVMVVLTHRSILTLLTHLQMVVV
jgi:hypothetical protein